MDVKEHEIVENISTTLEALAEAMGLIVERSITLKERFEDMSELVMELNQPLMEESCHALLREVAEIKTLVQEI